MITIKNISFNNVLQQYQNMINLKANTSTLVPSPKHLYKYISKPYLWKFLKVAHN